MTRRVALLTAGAATVLAAGIWLARSIDSAIDTLIRHTITTRTPRWEDT